MQCHKEIAERVANRRGFHGRQVISANGESKCATCHQEHFGANLDLIRWPTTREKFDHRQTGYPLQGRHASLRCSECHNSGRIPDTNRAGIQVRDLNRTFLGLSPACISCHRDVHSGRLGATCAECHGFDAWRPVAKFDHARTRFPLTGAHIKTPCAKCHGETANVETKPLSAPAVHPGLRFGQCVDCHKDPHNRVFSLTCEKCHATEGWRPARLAGNFDHAATGFALKGKHAVLDCAKCHPARDFKKPVAHAKCLDCHQDFHRAQFRERASGGDCAECHTEESFRPARFIAANHGATRFPLDGRHASVPCAGCHKPAGSDRDYHPAYQTCAACHRDPHGNQFAGAGCDSCHNPSGFLPAVFTLERHQSTAFPLKGAHAAVACFDCHQVPAGDPAGPRRYRFADLKCSGCHRDPHKVQGGALLMRLKADCEACHTVQSWRDALPFDHASTGFALRDAHAKLACNACHRQATPGTSAGPPVFGAATARNCAGCHQDPHGNQFAAGGAPAACEQCHTQVSWKSVAFDHNRDSSFSLTGAHARVACRGCHQNTVENGRSFVKYRGTARECAGCH